MDIRAVVALCVCVSVVLSSPAAAASCVRTNSSLPARLPLTAIPNHYEITLSLPDPNSCTEDLPCGFSGKVSIAVTVPEPTTCITIHMGTYLTYGLAAFVSDTGTTSASGHFYDAATQFLRLVFESELPSGEGNLVIQYTGEVNIQDETGLFVVPNALDESKLLGGQSDAFIAEKARKYFESSSKGHQNHKRSSKGLSERNWGDGTEKMFATQFEQSNARNMYPSFDEPALKAVFQVVITVPTLTSPLMVLTNTEMLATTSNAEDNTTTFTFSDTMIMSTYLVAIAVGRFGHVSGTQGGVDFRVFTPVGLESYAQHALNISMSCVDWFGDIWSFPYSKMNPKMDSIAVNGLGDAMENQGLLTYDPSFLLCEPSKCTEVELAFISLVACHEITHQWFGDTITTPWWTELYLNEGFARYEQYVSVDHFYPQLDIWNNDLVGSDGPVSFIEFTFQRALSLDFQGIGPPIVVTPQSEKLLSTSLLYEKGASVNHMLATHIGANNWNKALGIEVNSHVFGNPTYLNLLASFDAVVPGVSKKFAPWLLTKGFPIVSLSYDAATCTLTGTQAPVNAVSGEGTIWWIPLYVNVNVNGTTSQILMEFDGQSTSAISKIACMQPDTTVNFEGNFNQSAFTVTSYTYENLMWLTNEKVSTSTPEAEKKLFVQESTILAQTSHQPISVPLAVLAQLGPSLAKESYPVAAAGRMVLQVATNMFAMTMVLSSALPAAAYASIETAMRSFYGNILERTGITGNQSLSALRAPAVLHSVVYNNNTVLSELQRIFTTTPDVTEIPADIRQPTFWVAASSAIANLVAKLQNSSLPIDIRQDIAFGLAGVSRADVAKAIDAIDTYGEDDATTITLLGNMYRYNNAVREDAFQAISKTLKRCIQTSAKVSCQQAASTVLMGVQYTTVQIMRASALLEEAGLDPSQVKSLKQLGHLNELLVKTNT